MLIATNPTPPKLGLTQSATTASIQAITDWLSENKTAVYIVAGALLLLAILRR